MYLRKTVSCNERETSTTKKGFTLIELLVVIAIIALLVSIMLPSLAKAKELARQATCMTNISGQIKAINMYASEEDGCFPIGPEVLLYGIAPYQEIMSNQIWLSTKAYNAHGALLERDYVDPAIFFCPSDDSGEKETQLPIIRNREDKDAYCSYYYRQMDGQSNNPPTIMRIEQLDKNATGGRISAFVMDANSTMTGWDSRTNHSGKKVQLGYIGGGASTYNTPNGKLSLGPDDGANFVARLDEILELADSLGG